MSLLRFIFPFHFLATLAMFLFIALMVIENDQTARALLLLPVVASWFASKLLFSMDQAEKVKDIIQRNK